MDNTTPQPPVDKPTDLEVKNATAFLDMLAISEGTYRIGDRGYNCLVGSTEANPKLFPSYADHPRISVVLRAGPKPTRLVSTAAGRYQILARSYDAYKTKCNLPDFSPRSQDKIALTMIKEQGALGDVRAGRLNDAVAKCRNIWASLPGAGYGQNENTMARITTWYIQCGGMISWI